MRKTRVTNICEFCKKPYEVIKSREKTSRFCSYSCRSKVISPQGNTHWKWAGGKITADCKVCGTSFTRDRGITGGTYEYCSQKCANIGKIKSFDITCKNCGVVFTITRSHFERGSRYCSPKCSFEHFRGENHHLWRGGDREYPKQWTPAFRKMIRERDNYTCAICKEYGKDVHHINYVKNDTIPENCITLCHSCHAKTNSNREYWIDFFKNLPR